MKAACNEHSSTCVIPRAAARQSLSAGLLSALLALSSAAPAIAQEQWHPGLIDQKTRAVATDAKRQFEHCIVEQLEKLTDAANVDPRDTTNELINQCTDKLEVISVAHKQNDVPEQFTLQFISKIKNGFVRQLLPMMQRRAAAAG